VNQSKENKYKDMFYKENRSTNTLSRGS